MFGGFNPLTNMKVSWGYFSQYMEPPTRKMWETHTKDSVLLVFCPKHQEPRMERFDFMSCKEA